jgi:hypothetical protein
MTSRAHLEQLIARFVDDLFVNGSGQQADRLVLTVDGPPSRDLGGWCKAAIADRLREALALVLGPPPEPIVASRPIDATMEGMRATIGAVVRCRFCKDDGTECARCGGGRDDMSVQNCPWCGEGTWNGRVCLTCGAREEKR